MKNKFDALVQDIKKCQTCVSFLPNPPKPIVSVSLKCKILIIGQAPGNKVHQSGISFDLKIANLGQDGQILQYARSNAENILDEDPQLQKTENQILVRQLKQIRRSNVNWSVIS